VDQEENAQREQKHKGADKQAEIEVKVAYPLGKRRDSPGIGSQHRTRLEAGRGFLNEERLGIGALQQGSESANDANLRRWVSEGRAFIEVKPEVFAAV